MNNNSDHLSTTKWADLPTSTQKNLNETITTILTRQLYSDWLIARKFDSMNENISFEEYASRRITFMLTAPATII